ncbi:hypothetical protein [Desulfocicer niacini]
MRSRDRAYRENAQKVENAGGNRLLTCIYNKAWSLIATCEDNMQYLPIPNILFKRWCSGGYLSLIMSKTGHLDSLVARAAENRNGSIFQVFLKQYVGVKKINHY